MEPEKLIGKKVKGFKFENSYYLRKMNAYIGKTGIIKQYIITNEWFVVEFDDDSFYYPADQIKEHLVEDEIPTLSDGVMMLVSDNNVDWQTEYVFGQRKGIYLVWNNSIDTTCSTWLYAKPIEPTKEEQLKSILGSSDKVIEIMELFKN